jgi:hypothetical protein
MVNKAADKPMLFFRPLVPSHDTSDEFEGKKHQYDHENVQIDAPGM